MKYTITLLMGMLVACTACQKKKNTGYTVMTVYINGDSAWSTNSVISDNASGIGYVSGVNPRTGERIDLSLFDYRDGNKTYPITSSFGTSTTSYNRAVYQHGGILTEANSGSIAVTGHTAETIIGAFDISTSVAHISGIFRAPKPD